VCAQSVLVDFDDDGAVIGHEVDVVYCVDVMERRRGGVCSETISCVSQSKKRPTTTNECQCAKGKLTTMHDATTITTQNSSMLPPSWAVPRRHNNCMRTNKPISSRPWSNRESF
jgi:hypothetical protein